MENPNQPQKQNKPRLEEIKLHLRIDHDAEDALLSHLTDVAAEHVESLIRSPLPDPLPASLKHAMFLLVAHYYVNWEAVSDKPLNSVPLAFDALIGPHRRNIYPRAKP